MTRYISLHKVVRNPQRRMQAHGVDANGEIILRIDPDIHMPGSFIDIEDPQEAENLLRAGAICLPQDAPEVVR